MYPLFQYPPHTDTHMAVTGAAWDGLRFTLKHLEIAFIQSDLQYSTDIRFYFPL